MKAGSAKRLSIYDQRRLLKKRLILVPLTGSFPKETGFHRNLIAGYKNLPGVANLEQFLKKEAADRDVKGLTKIYLVIDKETSKIVCFFGLGCGLLYKPIEKIELPAAEQIFVDALITAELKGQDVDALLKNGTHLFPGNRLEELADLAKEQSTVKLAIHEEINDPKTSIVREYYPAIELTHFGRNAAYEKPAEIEFSIGIYVFWEMIVPIIQNVSSQVGARYLYLFAAEKNKKRGANQKKKLLEYYTHELGFEQTRKENILKPVYDANCLSMIQLIRDLDEKRESVWLRHEEN